MYGPPKVKTSKRSESVGHCDLLVYITGKTLVAYWKPMVGEMICKKGKEAVFGTCLQWCAVQ